MPDKGDPTPKPHVRQPFYGSPERDFYPHRIQRLLEFLLKFSDDGQHAIEGREKRMERLLELCLKRLESLERRLSQVGHAGLPLGGTRLPTGRRQRSERENYHNLEPTE